MTARLVHPAAKLPLGESPFGTSAEGPGPIAPDGASEVGSPAGVGVTVSGVGAAPGVAAGVGTTTGVGVRAGGEATGAEGGEAVVVGGVAVVVGGVAGGGEAVVVGGEAVGGEVGA